MEKKEISMNKFARLRKWLWRWRRLIIRLMIFCIVYVLIVWNIAPKCPKCDKFVGFRDTYCSRCGTKLDASETK